MDATTVLDLDDLKVAEALASARKHPGAYMSAQWVEWEVRIGGRVVLFYEPFDAHVRYSKCKTLEDAIKVYLLLHERPKAKSVKEKFAL